MPIGKSPLRERSPLPQGLRKPQLFRWAKLFTNWLQTFRSSTWYYSVSQTTFTSVYNQRLSVSISETDGDSATITWQVVNAFGSKIGVSTALIIYLSESTKGSPALIGANAFVSTGTALWQHSTGTRFQAYTNASGTFAARLSVDAADRSISVYPHGIVAHGLMYAGSKLEYT